MQTYYIYVLVDPRNEAVRYVGITINPQARLREHTGGMGENQAKEEWVAELTKLGLKPSMKILEESDNDIYAAERELHWIQKLLEEGAALTNVRTKRRQGFAAPVMEGWATIRSAAATLKAEGYKTISPNKIAKLAAKGKIQMKTDILNEKIRLVKLDELRKLFATRLHNPQTDE